MLVEVGEGLDRLPSLAVLHMENNRIESIHESFGRCRALTKLDLSSNNLRQLPSSMSKLRKLQRLGCANNMLRRIPSSMGQMKILKEFDLRYRELSPTGCWFHHSPWWIFQWRLPCHCHTLKHDILQVQ